MIGVCIPIASTQYYGLAGDVFGTALSVLCDKKKGIFILLNLKI